MSKNRDELIIQLMKQNWRVKRSETSVSSYSFRKASLSFKLFPGKEPILRVDSGGFLAPLVESSKVVDLWNECERKRIEYEKNLSSRA